MVNNLLDSTCRTTAKEKSCRRADTLSRAFEAVAGLKGLANPALLDMSQNRIIVQTMAQPQKSALPKVTNDISYISFCNLHKT